MSMLSKSVLRGTCLVALGLLACSGCDNRTNQASTPAANGKQPAADVEKQSNDQQTDPAAQPIAAPEKGPPTLVDLSRAAEQKIRRAMQTKIDVTLDDMALQEFVELVGKQGKFPVWLNETALSEEGIAGDEPLTDELHDVTIEQALNWTLEPLGLTWMIEDEILKVTTEIDAEERLFTRTYDVSSLLAIQQQRDKKQTAAAHPLHPRFSQFAHRDPTGNQLLVKQQTTSTGDRLTSNRDGGVVQATSELMQFGGFGTDEVIGGSIAYAQMHPRNETVDADWLIELILFVTSGPWMETDGTGGTMDIMNDVLIVRQTAKVQQEVDHLLAALNSVETEKRIRGSIAARSETYPFDEDRKIHAALKKQFSVKYLEKPLSSVAADLATRHKIRVRIVETALAEEGIALDEHVSLTSNDVSLGSILHVILEPLGLTYYVSEGALWINTEIDAEENLHTTVYDVRDLVGPEDDYESLIEVIQQETSGPWREVDGTGGTVNEAELLGALAIWQTHKLHQEIDQLLADMRATTSAQPKIERPKRNVDAVVTRVYNLAGMKLVDDLLSAVPKFVAADTWGDKKKTHSIQKVGESLVIRQTVKVHEQIERFLQQFGYHHYLRGGFAIGAKNGTGYF